jgi:hypothetical protein
VCGLYVPVENVGHLLRKMGGNNEDATLPARVEAAKVRCFVTYLWVYISVGGYKFRSLAAKRI